MVDLRRVSIVFIADTKKLIQGFRKVDKKTQILTRSFKRMGGALLAAFSARAVFRGFTKTLRDTEALIRTARGVGFATNEYRQLIFALDAVGVSSESARIALGDLQKRLSRPSFQKFFREVGLEPNELLTQSRAQQLQTILERLNQLRDDPNLPSIAGLLFEEQSGKDIAKVVLQFEDFLGARREYEQIVGRGTTEQDEKAILQLNKQVKSMKLAWEELKIQIVSDSAPEITAILQELAQPGTIRAIVDAISDAAFAFSSLSKDVRFFAQEIGKLDDAVPDWIKDFITTKTGPAIAARIYSAPFRALREARLGSEISPILQGTNASAAAGGAGRQGVNVSVTNNFSNVNERRMPGLVTDTIQRELAPQ